MAVEEEPPKEVNSSAKLIQSHKSAVELSQTEDDASEETLTPYEKLIKELQHDEKVSKEISSGRRIGFYRIRGDLGSGNFSQVKLGYHCIAKGIIVSWLSISIWFVDFSCKQEFQVICLLRKVNIHFSY